MQRHVEIRRGVYHDSVTLLSVSQQVQRLDGVDQALVAMATPLNLEILRDLGFATDDLDGVSPNDLVVAVSAGGQALDAALAEVDRALTAQAAPAPSDRGEHPPRTTASALRRAAAAVALISVPGEHAFVEAMDALRAGRHVMLFSDNVAVAQEIALKAEGDARDLLVMGPDCGTAIVGGVGLGFANVVHPGPVGVVAASGTGAQQVCCLLDAAGVGVSHVLGVGGRDLSADVGGAASLRALELLDDDPATELIILVSKPPDARARDAVMDVIAQCATPVVVGFLGLQRPDLMAVTDEAVRRLGGTVPPPRRWGPDDLPAGGFGTLRGLFSGGTLCHEAMVIAAAALGPVRSNIPLDPAWALGDDLDGEGHVMIDFGDDDLTRGRPHPMIDHSLRSARLEREAQRPGSHVALLDVVLGHGADGDPAGALAPVIAAARQRAAARGDHLAVVVSLCGTRGDPQGLEDQAHRLSEAGAVVHLSNAGAAREAVNLVSGVRS
jgi:FdrA protein